MKNHRFLVIEMEDGNVSSILINDEAGLRDNIQTVYGDCGAHSDLAVEVELTRLRKRPGNETCFDGWREDGTYLIVKNVTGIDLNDVGTIFRC